MSKRSYPHDAHPSPPLDIALRGTTSMNDHAHGRAPRMRERLPTVTLTRPRCPRCNAITLHKFRSIRDQGDGTALAWMRCLGCSHRFRLLLE